MGLLDNLQKNHDEFNKAGDEHKVKLSHELIAGAAAYAAVRTYNKHCAKNGKPNSHTMAKELLAGFAGGALDKLIETKGLDLIDKQKIKKHAEDQVKEYYIR